MLKSTAALVIVLLCSFSAFPQQAPRNSAGQSAAERNSPGLLQQIIPGPYAYTSTNFNSGVIVTSEGVVVLDAPNSTPVPRAERQPIPPKNGAPVRGLVPRTG